MHNRILTRLHILLLALCVTVPTLAQSGRQRPDQRRTDAGVNRESDEKKVHSGERNPADADDIIRVSSGLLAIPVSVTDTQGRQVEGLGSKDFRLSIDGIEVDIDEFSDAEIPVRMAFLLDNSSSVASARDFERRASTRFLQRVLRVGKDAAAVYSISTEWRLEHPLTTDVTLLLNSIERMSKPLGATALLDGMMAAITGLEAETGRRVMVIVSDGEDTVSETPFNSLLEKLRSSSIQVFVIRTTEYENFKRTGTRELSENIRQLTAERRIQEIVQQTGGAVFSPIDDTELDTAFSAIANELSRQYILGYYPEADSLNSAVFRRITVSLREGLDHRIRTRAGYIGPR